MARKTMRLLVLSLAATTVLAARARDSQAAVVSSPFGIDAQVRVIIGSRDGQQVVLWERLSTHECRTTVLGGASGLNDSYKVATSHVNDNVWLPSGGWSSSTCGGVAGGPLSYNGHFLDVFLGGGNDGASAGAGDTFLLGEGGNDFLASWNPNAVLSGADGNDTLEAHGSGFFQILNGGAGDDCLTDENSTATTFDCGGGSDRYVGTPSNAVNCEDPRPFCS
jgi:Ca2+-binding RTX toxin-like protein